LTKDGRNFGSMDLSERIAAHRNMVIPDTYIPQPFAHLGNKRDSKHYEWAKDMLKGCKSAVDIGPWDGWLDFLLIHTIDDFRVTGVELIPELAAAANRYAQLTSGITGRYTCLTGAWHDVDLGNQTWDAAIAFEVLEHVPIEEVESYVTKMEERARLILISLPDQRHEENPQHCWTPTEKLIREMWQNKRNFNITSVTYPGTTVPGNWLIFWEGI